MSVEAVFAAFVSELRAAAQSMTAQNLMTVDSLPWHVAGQNLESALATEIARIENKAGLLAVNGLHLPKEKAARLKFFTVDNPYAMRYAKDHAAALVVEVTSSTRDAVRAAIERGFAEHQTPPEIARILRGTKDRPGIIGLHSKDEGAVGNYYRELYDAGVNPALREKLVGDYAGKLLRNRGRNIARTETAFATESGKLASWQNARDNGFVTSFSRKRWFTGYDERTCDVCAPLHNVTVGLEEEFPGGFAAPPAHPSCRCNVTLVTAAPGTTWKFPDPISEDEVERLREANREHTREQARRFRARWRKVPEGDD